jgi:hypothetical protein
MGRLLKIRPPLKSIVKTLEDIGSCEHHEAGFWAKLLDKTALVNLANFHGALSS